MKSQKCSGSSSVRLSVPVSLKRERQGLSALEPLNLQGSSLMFRRPWAHRHQPREGRRCGAAQRLTCQAPLHTPLPASQPQRYDADKPAQIELLKASSFNAQTYISKCSKRDVCYCQESLSKLTEAVKVGLFTWENGGSQDI